MPGHDAPPPLQGKAELIEHLAGGAKPASDWRIGTEHEKFGFRLADLRPLSYEGPQGIEAMLRGLAQESAWRPVEENGRVIALIRDDGASITLEPAGQLELSGAQLETIHQTCCEVSCHLKEVKAVADRLGVASWAWASNPSGDAKTCPGCPRAATGSCATTCPRSAASAST
jgi:glutamate--cysteine ligase